MRLVTYEGGFGRIDGDALVPMGDDPVEYLRTGRAAEGPGIPLAGQAVCAPVPRPGTVICVGLNHRDHAEETGQASPDFETELGVVIGRPAKDVDAADAIGHVGGSPGCNDVSARDLQFRSSRSRLGKAIDGFLPTGPWIVTPDEVGDPQTLGIRCLVNGDVEQDSSTKQMVFGVAEPVAFISRTITLEPGDLIATGTPPGVGMARTPPRWLRDGDTVRVEIERVGALTNTVRVVAPRGGS
jgi:2-keto-4-pentenoate hydratase/2-oxohepta-3-ene-1,7-dioic acid hydratase in catechol pathway